MLETHIRGEQQAAARQPPGLPAPRHDQRGLEPRRSASTSPRYHAIPGRGARAVRIEIELHANSGSMPQRPGRQGRDRSPTSTSWSTASTARSTRPTRRRPTGSRVGGEAMFAPLNIMEVVQSRWAGPQPAGHRGQRPVARPGQRRRRIQPAGSPATPPQVPPRRQLRSRPRAASEQSPQRRRARYSPSRPLPHLRPKLIAVPFLPIRVLALLRSTPSWGGAKEGEPRFIETARHDDHRNTRAGRFGMVLRDFSSRSFKFNVAKSRSRVMPVGIMIAEFGITVLHRPNRTGIPRRHRQIGASVMTPHGTSTALRPVLAREPLHATSSQTPTLLIQVPVVQVRGSRRAAAGRMRPGRRLRKEVRLAGSAILVVATTAFGVIGLTQGFQPAAAGRVKAADASTTPPLSFRYRSNRSAVPLRAWRLPLRWFDRPVTFCRTTDGGGVSCGKLISALPASTVRTSTPDHANQPPAPHFPGRAAASPRAGRPIRRQSPLARDRPRPRTGPRFPLRPPGGYAGGNPNIAADEGASVHQLPPCRGPNDARADACPIPGAGPVEP